MLLVPKEHGAYGQLLFPLLTAWLAVRPSLASLLFGVAAAGIFLAHEGLAVRLGHRGPRARREQHARAATSLGVFGGLGLLAGIAALALSPPAARLAAAVTAGAGGTALLMTWLGRERTAGGEVLASTALASWALPVALASGAPPSSGLGLWIVWSVTFAAATLAVRGVIARTRREAWKGSVAAACGVLAAGGLALGWMPPAQPAALRTALLPAAALVVGLGLLPIGARHLHRVGWTIIVVSVTTMVLLLR